VSGAFFELELAVDVQAEPALPDQLVRLLTLRTLAHTELLTGQIDIGVWFVGPPRMRELNAEHRDQDLATDVLSFPIDEAGLLDPDLPRQLGDVFVCGPYVAEQVANGTSMLPANEQQRGDRTVEQALARCVVHGVLHLCGFDHEPDERAAAIMFALEQIVLDELLGEGLEL